MIEEGRRKPKHLLIIVFDGVLASFMREQNRANEQADFYDDDEEDDDESEEEL